MEVNSKLHNALLNIYYEKYVDKEIKCLATCKETFRYPEEKMEIMRLRYCPLPVDIPVIYKIQSFFQSKNFNPIDQDLTKLCYQQKLSLRMELHRLHLNGRNFLKMLLVVKPLCS